MRLLYYKTSSGRLPVWEYIEGLPRDDRAAIIADLDHIIEYGILNNPLVVTRKLMGGQFMGRLWEIKTGLGRQQRIFYCLIAGPAVVLLHACKKQKQEGQAADLKTALSRMKEVLL